MDDVRAVMDAVKIERAAQFGISEGGSLAALFAATHPERTQSLTLYGAFARFRHWIPDDEGFDSLMTAISTNIGAAARACRTLLRQRQTIPQSGSGGVSSNGSAPVHQPQSHLCA